jgi:hypothetical protein
LTPLVKAWPGERHHQRAVTGLEVLRAIGTDTALMQLSGIAQKLKFKALQNRARGFMEAIAVDRGLSREQLEDRIVPDLDLDERGSRVFDFGPRRFRFVLGPDFKPLVRDEAGKLKGDLPRPGSRDDPEKAGAALRDWKLLKKQVREVARVQAQRLEQAMIAGRRWPVADFETFLVRHPLLTNLARLLLWGGFDEQGKLVRAFRVTEEGGYADVEDRPCTLEGLAAVGLAHPLHLGERERSAWGQVFGDYEIIPPFPQLGRRVHLLELGEKQGYELTRFGEAQVQAVAVLGILKKHGWRDSRWEPGLGLQGHYKRFPGPDVTAVVRLQSASGDSYRVESACFLEGLVEEGSAPGAKVRLGEVDPVVVSEVLGTLNVLASKGV